MWCGLDCCGGEEVVESDDLPRTDSPIFGKSRMAGVQYSGKASLNLRWCRFQAWLFRAHARLSVSVVFTDPVVISSDNMKDNRPVNIVATLHAGFQEAGWKSDMEKHIFLSGAKRPEGVSILMPGGLKGYSGGNIRTPWYSPPSKGESEGPRIR